MNTVASITVSNLLRRSVSIDLEVNPEEAQIFALAAVAFDANGPKLVAHADIPTALARLDAFCGDFDHVIGHNILRHDLPYLVAASPKLAALAEAPIDTLWLNPLAFPRNPYHHLVKHYHDGRLQTGQVNDPENDARLVFDVLGNQISAFDALNQTSPDALTAYHYLCSQSRGSAGFDQVFTAIRGRRLPSAQEAGNAIRHLLDGVACAQALEELLDRLGGGRSGWPMAYALSWISVAGGDSVMPPWVRAQFPEAACIVRRLRDSDCGDASCDYCHIANDPKRALKRWFDFDAYRPEPADAYGRPLQEVIVARALKGDSLLGILPTGTGKSVCYQLPALSRFDKTGALTVVISPLVALMADQVQGWHGPASPPP